MSLLNQPLSISAIILILVAGAIDSQAIAARSSDGHGSKKGDTAGESMSQFKSTQPQIQQTPKTGQQFKYLEQEKVRSQDQQNMLVHNQNRIAEMEKHQLKAQQQVRDQQLDVKQEGVRLRAQEQLTTGLKSQLKEQQRLLQIESNREQIRAMNLSRTQVQSQLDLLQQQRSQVAASEKLAADEKQQLQERLQIMSQQRDQIAEQERLLNQQQEQVEERLKLMTQQHQLLQERQRLWTEFEPLGS